jgi:hypothetical protein
MRLLCERPLPEGAAVQDRFVLKGKQVGFPELRFVLVKRIGPRLSVSGDVLEKAKLAFFEWSKEAET